jgi:hypothetical protein
LERCARVPRLTATSAELARRVPLGRVATVHGDTSPASPYAAAVRGRRTDVNLSPVEPQDGVEVWRIARANTRLDCMDGIGALAALSVVVHTVPELSGSKITNG